MIPARPRTEEREALSRLLASGCLERSPNLERILVYLCNKYFDGEAGEIKEYHIATEVLGRPADFDPKQNSIVRVEMHRLRRRLREYYDGRKEPVQIVLPEKSYIPEFRTTGDRTATALVRMDLDTVPRPAPPRAGNAWWMAAAALLVAGVVWLWPRAEQQPPPATATLPAASPTRDAPNPEEEIRILAGRPSGRYVDRYGRVWQGDTFSTGGASVPVHHPVLTRGFDRNLFTAMREGDFTIDIPLKRGSYEVMLIFAETQYGEGNPLGGGEAYRVFNVFANGRSLLSSFDALSDARGPNLATARAFRDISPAADGKLHLKFATTGSGKAFVNAILLRPGIAGRYSPVRIVCRPDAFRDSKNQTWEPDHFYRGGVQITRPNGAPLAEDGDVLRGERYGSFTYSIPVPPGSYTARLYFWEYWWGKGHPGNGGPASRLFDVFANHQRVLENFSVIRTDPTNQVSVQTFRGLKPTPQGKIELDFIPTVNYALLNALEIVDESP
jgi:hypothetical protein